MKYMYADKLGKRVVNSIVASVLLGLFFVFFQVKQVNAQANCYGVCAAIGQECYVCYMNNPPDPWDSGSDCCRPDDGGKYYDKCAGELGCQSPCCYDGCYERYTLCEQVHECGWKHRGRRGWKYVCFWYTACYPNTCRRGCVCPPAPPPPTCTVNLLPSSDTVSVGDTSSLTASVVPANGIISKVNFSSSNSSITSVSPPSDTTATYSTVTSANSPGTATVTADVIMIGSPSVRCTDTSTITVPPNLDAWWQVKDGDVVTNGSIASEIPSGEVFIDDGIGGFPGLPIFANSLDTNSNPLSSTLWEANTSTSLKRLFDYAYFDNLVPADIVFEDPSTTSLASGGTEFYGYYWYKATSGLTINSDINLGDRKVILFVEGGDLNINGRINLNDGSGFFMTVSDDNISVDPTVTGTPSLEGLYVTDGNFNTGLGAVQLHIRGSVASFGSFTLQRDLGAGNTSPSELFEFAPDQMLLFPAKLASRRTRWNEIAP